MRIGIDLGGTKIEGLALADDGRELARRRIAAPRGDYGDTIHTVVHLVADLEGETQQRGSVGIGIPGAISPATGLIKNANSTWLNGRPLDRDLALALDRPVRLANDANCFALSEATDGAAAGAAVVFGVIIGTGTGGGLVIGGRVVTGANAIAGEWGHNPLPAPRDDERPGPPLLRTIGMHRNVPLRSGTGARLCGSRWRRRAGARCGGACRRRRRARHGMPRAIRASLRTRDRVGDQRCRSGCDRPWRGIVE